MPTESLSKKRKIHADDVKISLRLKIARREEGLSRIQVADALKITQQLVDKYEKGDNRISARTLFYTICPA